MVVLLMKDPPLANSTTLNRFAHTAIWSSLHECCLSFFVYCCNLPKVFLVPYSKSVYGVNILADKNTKDLYTFCELKRYSCHHIQD